jgi:hypothetical protein
MGRKIREGLKVKPLLESTILILERNAVWSFVVIEIGDE